MTGPTCPLRTVVLAPALRQIGRWRAIQVIDLRVHDGLAADQLGSVGTDGQPKQCQRYQHTLSKYVP